MTKLLWARPVHFILLRAFIPWVIHTARWKMQSQVNIPSVITFIDIRFLPAKVLFFVHYLLFQRPVDISWPPFDKGWSARTPEKWFFLKVFLLKFLACTLKSTELHSYGAKIQRVTAKKELINSKSNIANAKAITCFFYILTICTPRNTMDKGCENLAVSIGSTMLQGLDKPAK